MTKLKQYLLAIQATEGTTAATTITQTGVEDGVGTGGMGGMGGLGGLGLPPFVVRLADIIGIPAIDPPLLKMVERLWYWDYEAAV